jgi:hypothetical protein
MDVDVMHGQRVGCKPQLKIIPCGLLRASLVCRTRQSAVVQCLDRRRAPSRRVSDPGSMLFDTVVMALPAGLLAGVAPGPREVAGQYDTVCGANPLSTSRKSARSAIGEIGDGIMMQGMVCERPPAPCGVLAPRAPGRDHDQAAPRWRGAGACLLQIRFNTN